MRPMASLGIALALVGPATSAERGEGELETSVLRAKPGIVLISSEMDAGRQQGFDMSTVWASGALGYDIERPNTQRIEVRVGWNDAVVVYCDCPDEAASTRVALQLMQASYRRVAVVRWGFCGVAEAGVAMAPKPSTPVPVAESELRTAGGAV